MASGLAKDMKAMGLSEGFSVGELKSAFRAEAKLCHPDVSGAEGLAFARLRDRYDRLLECAERRDARSAKSGRSAAGPRASAKPRPQPEARAPSSSGERCKTKPKMASAKTASAKTASASTKKSGGAKKPREPQREWLKGVPPQGGTGRAGIGRADAKDGDAQALAYYRDGLEKYEAFQAVNRDRSMELKFLYGLTKKNIALVDLHTFLRLLDTLEDNARASLSLFRLALGRDPNQAWGPDAVAKSESLDRQLSRCLTLRAEVTGGS